MESLVYIALFAPLAGALFAGLFGMKKKELMVGIVNSSLLAVSFLASLFLAIYVATTGNTVHVTLCDDDGGCHLCFHDRAHLFNRLYGSRQEL